MHDDNHDEHHHPREILKSTLVFVGILLAGLFGVGAAQFFNEGEMNAIIKVVDNVVPSR